MNEQSKTPNTGIATCGQCGQEMHPTDYLPRIKDENEALRELLDEAADEIADWGAYAGEYYQDKHGLAETVKRFKDAARKEQP